MPPAAALCCALLVLAGCGEKQDVLEPSGSKQRRADARLLPERRPRRHLRGAGGRRLQGGRARTWRSASRPTRRRRSSRWRPAAWTSRSRTSPRCCAPATRDSAWSASPRSSRSRSPRSSRCRRRRSARRRDLEGKTVGTAGIDYQHAYLETMLREAGVDPASVKERNVGFSLTPALLTGRVDAVLGRVLELRGHRAEAARQAAADHPHRGRRRADLQRAGAGGERGRARARRRQDPRLHRRASRAGRATLRREPGRGAIDGLLEANPGPRPRSSSARWWT